MKAKEMFEQLGYMLDCNEEEGVITYSRDILDKKTFGYIDSKMITFDNYNVYFTNVDCITIEELKAINKQLYELGWLDD
jgi:hypothetical protein